MSAVRASDILCCRHFQMANLQMLLISKTNWISVLLWELGLGGLWNCRVQLAYHPVLKLWHKQILAHQLTSRMTSSTCKIHTLSWLPASRSELNYPLLLMRQQCPSRVCCLCIYMPLYTVARSWSLSIIGLSGIRVEGAVPTVTSAPWGTVLQANKSVSSGSLAYGRVIAGQIGKPLFLIHRTIT